MASPTRDHGRIKDATFFWLYQQLRGRSCEAGGSDTRLYVAKYGVLTYPDVVVTCSPHAFLDEKRDTIIDATVIVEVLSPSIRAEHHVRQPDGSWLFREIAEPTAVIELASIGCRLPLGALYERVEFATEP